MLTHELQLKFLSLNKRMISRKNSKTQPCSFFPSDFSPQVAHPSAKRSVEIPQQTIHEHDGTHSPKANFNLRSFADNAS